MILIRQEKERLCVYFWKSGHGPRFWLFRQAHMGEFWSIEAVRIGTRILTTESIDTAPVMNIRHRLG